MAIETVTVDEKINDQVIKAFRRKAQDRARRWAVRSAEDLFAEYVGDMLAVYVRNRAFPLSDPYVIQYRADGYTVYGRDYAGDPDEDFRL